MIPSWPPWNSSTRWTATAPALAQTTAGIVPAAEMAQADLCSGEADRRLYETAVLATLRDRLRGSDIWVAGSRDYRAFEDYLLPAEAVQNVGIGGETDPDRYVAGARHRSA